MWGNRPEGYKLGYKRGPLCSISDKGKVENASVLDLQLGSAESLKRVVNAVTVQQLPPSLVNSRHSSKHVVVKL